MLMKQGIRIVCLLLIGLLLMGCVPESTTAPESSGAELTEKALQQIKTLGTSPDDN